MKVRMTLAAACVAAFSSCGAAAPSAPVAAPFRIERNAMPRIVVGETMRPFVMRAAQDVAGDMEKIFGARPEISVGAAPGGDCIVLEKSTGETPVVPVKSTGKMPVVPVKSTGETPVVPVGEGWENYLIESMPGNVLKITGSDDRGVMFGLYRFASDCLGVDPFYYWSGIEPAKAVVREWKEGISIRQGDPSFKFRGWFINDEDFLNGFRPKENGTRKIDYPRYHVCFGPALADKIYEAAVRAGFNTMICASYVDILNPDERRLVEIASSRGLYVTMHHQEPVGAGALQLDLHFPEIRGTTYASHPDLWRRAWKRYVGEWAKFPDVVWQIGLRGRRDTPFWAVHGVPASAGKPDEAEDRRRAGLISDAMREQLAMIEEATGRRPEHTATQLWWEGADFYARGLLDIPDGTIVVFSDNSAGFKLQPDIGGVKSLDPAKRFGIYYHLALVHGNHRCEVVPPLRTRQILGFAHGKGARDLVLFNVSNVLPFLYTVAAAGEMSRDLGAFDANGFRDRWTKARFGGKFKSVARAVDLYFAAYETEYSRDKVSSYGSPRERAPLAILHDGMLCRWLDRQVDWFASGRRGTPAPVESQYEKNPDRIVPLPDNLYNRATHDQEPNLENVSRTRIRAVAQAAAFERCEEQIGRAASGMDDAQKRQLFERFGYPAAFMRLSSQAFAEMSAAREARCLGDEPGAMRHAKSALSLMEERDALDGRYASGRWSGWYDRDLIYPCRSVTARLRAALPALFAAGICGDRPSFIRGDRLSFDLTVTNAAVERVDFGPGAAGGYAEFEVVGLDAAASGSVLRVAYACHPDGLSEKGDFWRETSARYLGPNVDLPILPANIDRYELYTLDHVGRYRAKLLQGLVRYARFSLDSQRGAVAIRNFRLVNDKVHSEGEREGSFTCSDSRLSQLWEASVRTCELSAIPSYVATHVTPNVKTLPYLADGAKRDRLVWSGDLWFAERTCFYGFSPRAPYMRGSIDMLAANQTPEGYVQASPWPEQPTPKAGEWGPFGSDEFACWFVPVLQDYYLHTADIATVKRHYPKVVKLMRYLAEHQRPDGIFEQRKETCKHAAGLVFGGSSLHHRSYMNILLWKTYADAAYLSDAVGGAEGDGWRVAAERLAASIRSSFWKDGKGYFALSEEDDSMGAEANALALAVKFATQDEAAKIMPRMKIHFAPMS